MRIAHLSPFSAKTCPQSPRMTYQKRKRLGEPFWFKFSLIFEMMHSEKNLHEPHEKKQKTLLAPSRVVFKVNNHVKSAAVTAS